MYRYLLLVMLLWLGAAAYSSEAQVTALRVPEGGIQPQAAVDTQGRAHLVYFKGAPAAGDLFYVISSDGGSTWSKPLRINRTPNSAIATGTIRGVHLALGKNNRPHVAWMGSKDAQPRGPNGAAPMLYTRLDDAGTAFESERNVMQTTDGLDGGGSLAADPLGHVYVVWHGNAPGTRDEAARQVFVAASQDEGQTFGRETPASAQATGCCACCGMRAFCDTQGRLYILYRAAIEKVNRDMVLLSGKAGQFPLQGAMLHPWKVPACVMSTASLAPQASGALAAWETQGQIHYARIDGSTGKSGAVAAAPGDAGKRKHPVAASDKNGLTLLAWTEGTGWNQGGAAAWQLIDAQGLPVGALGRAEGVPVWGLVAVFPRPNGGFAIIY